MSHANQSDKCSRHQIIKQLARRSIGDEKLIVVQAMNLLERQRELERLEKIEEDQKKKIED